MIASVPSGSHELARRSREPRLILLLFALVLFAGLITAVRSGDALRYPDEHDYHVLALGLAEGRGYVGPDAQPTAYRAPGFPGFLSLVCRVSARPLAAKVAHAGLLTLSAFLAYLLVRRLHPASGRYVPLLVLCYPVLIYASSTLYPQTLGTTLLVGVMLLAVRAPTSAPFMALAGVLGGGLVLVLPTYQTVLPVAAVYIVLLNRAVPARAWRLALLFLLGAAVVVAPWTWRNYRAFGRLVPVATNSGINLLLGNSEHTTANSGVNVDISRYTTKTAGMNEVERDRYYAGAALAWIRQHPGRAARLYATKLVNYFNYRNELRTRSEFSRLREAITFVTYYPLLALALLRLAWWRRYPLQAAELLLYAVYAGNAIPGAMFFTRIRFRLPCDALLIMIASMGIGILATEWKRRIHPR